MGLLVIGFPGSGKSTAIRKYCELHPKIYTKERDIRPVISIDCPFEISSKSIVETLLSVYDDEEDYKSTKASVLEARLINYINECQTKIIFIRSDNQD